MKLPFSQTLHFMEKQAIRERESYFQGRMVPQRENSPDFPWRENFAQKDVKGRTNFDKFGLRPPRNFWLGGGGNKAKTVKQIYLFFLPNVLFWQVVR